MRRKGGKRGSPTCLAASRPQVLHQRRIHNQPGACQGIVTAYYGRLLVLVLLLLLLAC